MNLTYGQLKKFVNAMSEDELNLNVTIYLSDVDEYYPVKHTDKAVESSAIDDGHPILVVT